MSPHEISSPAQGLAKLLGHNGRAIRAVVCVRRGDLGGKMLSWCSLNSNLAFSG